MTWEKYAKSGQDVYFRNGNKVIGIHKVEKGSTAWQRFLMKWVVTTNYWYSAPPDKYFKTKFVALRWVKLWIRKHPKG